MLERLKDSNRATGEYVRHLIIGAFEDKDRFKFKIVLVLEDILRSINNLHALT